MKIAFCTAAAVMMLAVPAVAVTVPVASYDMPNGSTGSFAYWDLYYTGAGATNSNGAALSGGVGDLTDGFIAPATWSAVENLAGTGPYVGWLSGLTPNPLITFNFAGSPTINAISIHMDNVGFGGVSAPGSILINGINTAFTAPAPGTNGIVNFTGLNLTGNSHTIQLNHANSWIFVSEVTFTSNVPEPASWAMMIAGFGLVGASLRRRQALAA